MKIKTAKGVETEDFKFRKTHHGPIVARARRQADRAQAGEA